MPDSPRHAKERRLEHFNALQHTTYLCGRLFDDLLDLYEASRADLNTVSYADLAAKLTELNRWSANLDLQVKILFEELMQMPGEDRRGLVAHDRRAVSRSTRRRTTDRRGPPAGAGPDHDART